jgi:hypothetical protein
MRLALVGFVVLAAAGCAHQTSTRHALEASGGWRELTSRHFVLRTDLGPGDGRAALAEFERTYALLQTLAFANDPPRDRIDVVLFENEQQFRRLAPPGAAGYFMPRQVADPDAEPTIAIHGRMLVAGQFEETTQRRFRHELTHLFLDHHVRWSPPWLEEGLAEYYSTLKLERSDAVIGTLPNAKILRVDIHLISSLIQGLAEDRVDFRQLPSVRELLNADYGTFHQPGRELPYYAGSWVFVHMMLNGPYGYSPRFVRFLDLVSTGTSAPEAWRISFDGVPLAQLELQFRNYALRSEMEERVLSVKAPLPTEPESVRRMRPDELHLMMARIRPWDSRENIFAAGAELAEARRLAGAKPSAELRFWSALYALRWRHFGAAELEVRAALAQEPTQPRYWLLLCELLSRTDRVQTPAPAAAQQETALQSAHATEGTQLDDAVDHLRPLARSAQALNFLARYYSDRGRVAEGLPFAERAVATEHGCWECADTLAQLQSSVRSETPVQPDVYTKPGIY